MKEILVNEGPRTEMVDSPIPRANKGQIVIKVEVSGTNPKDWKTWWALELPINMGDDLAGTVYEIGEDVRGFRVGDRVFAFHQVHTPHGSYAEYALAWSYNTSHLPSSTSFEEAATVPLAALTASLALYRTLKLPQPWCPASTSTPLLIYGGSSAVGAFAIKLCAQSNLHPIIAVAGAGCSYVSSLLDPMRGDAVVDYRHGRVGLEAGIQSALTKAGGFTHVRAALDAFSGNDSSEICIRFLRPGGKLAHVLPLTDLRLPEEKKADLVMITDLQGSLDDKPGARDFGFVMMQTFGRGMEDGWLKSHPYHVVPGGLRAVPTILENLKTGKASALKYVFRPGETKGI